jgi:hypothetical protein
MDCWFLVITLSLTAGVHPPSNEARLGPMSQQECLVSAKAIKAASPNIHPQCEIAIPGGQMIQGF